MLKQKEQEFRDIKNSMMKSWRIPTSCSGGSIAKVVMRGDSYPRGCKFRSQCCMLDGSLVFLFCEIFLMDPPKHNRFRQMRTQTLNMIKSSFQIRHLYAQIFVRMKY